MPVYLYKCESCGDELEIQHSIKDDAVDRYTHRDGCDGPLKRLIAGGTSFTWPGGAPTSKTYQ